MGCWLLIVLLLGLAAPVAGQVTATVQASGLAAILSGDLARAYKDAERAALREAVEQAVGTLVTGQTRVRSFSVIQDEILTRTEGYVERFSVLGRRRLDPRTCEVTIEAVVRLGALHRSLAALDLLVDVVGNPRLMCLGRERRAGQPPVEGGVAAALTRILGQASTRLTLVAPVTGGEQEAAFGDLSAAAALGARHGADVVVRAEAAVQPIPEAKVPFSDGVTLGQLGIHSRSAQVKLDALWSDSGEVFASLAVTERAAALTPEAAAEKAVRLGTERLAGQFVQRLAADWRERAYNGQWVRLVVLGDTASLGRFERELPVRTSSVEQLLPRSRTAGLAVFDARSRGSGFQVARELAAAGLADLAVEVEEVTMNTLKLRLGH
jgi:hypothetical protein